MKEKIDNTLRDMAAQLQAHRHELLTLNQADVEDCDQSDQALYDRLHINDKKVDGMIDSLQQVLRKESPVGRTLYAFDHPNGMKITNRTVPFGTLLIIYESRPDVTVEATAAALKSGNKIILKGGKEARRSNEFLHQCWMQALDKCGLPKDMIRYLAMDRSALQLFLKEPDCPIDLIVPRGGEKLIDYVRSVARCPVLVSGRGNNFLYVAPSADLDMAKRVIIESKVSKISACNALDKVLIDARVPDCFTQELTAALAAKGVEIITSPDEDTWQEEFLEMKIVVESCENMGRAIETINQYSGQHSAAIMCQGDEEADRFMCEVDCAAVYHNASTRFTDGYQYGLGAELAISTQKLHHRGPLGIEQLVTNKWYVKGNGQTR